MYTILSRQVGIDDWIIEATARSQEQAYALIDGILENRLTVQAGIYAGRIPKSWKYKHSSGHTCVMLLKPLDYLFE